MNNGIIISEKNENKIKNHNILKNYFFFIIGFNFVKINESSINIELLDLEIGVLYKR